MCAFRLAPPRRASYAIGVPELPEVETIRRDLEPLVVGRRIVDVEVDPTEGVDAPVRLGDAAELDQVFRHGPRPFSG